MNTKKLHRFSILVVAGLLLLSNRAHALFTPYMIVASNDFSALAATLTGSTAQERAEAKALARALKDFSKPSDSVAGDYRLFVAAAIHLGPFALQPPFGEVGSNLFSIFMVEAANEVVTTGDRIAALSDFVPTKKAASNQLAKAVAALTRVTTLTDPRLSILVGGQAYAKLVTANRLAAIGEAHPGFAPDSVVGMTIQHQEKGHSGHVQFDNATEAIDTDDSDGSMQIDTYTYTRTALNAATLVLQHDGGSGLNTTTVKLVFTSTTGGRFAFKDMRSDGTSQGTGTFTLH